MVGVRDVTPKPLRLYEDTFAGKAAKVGDDVISVLFPTWGNDRRKTRLNSAMASRLGERLGQSWTTPNENRDSNWLASGGSVDSLLETDLVELQARCSEMYRTNNVAHAAVEARVVNEIGTGVTPQARVLEHKGVSKEQAKKINDALDRQFVFWSKCGVDLNRSMSMGQFERLVNRSLGIYGEAIVVLSDTPSKSGVTLTCELIEPERISTPNGDEGKKNVRLGVKTTSDGFVEGYYVEKSHPGDTDVNARTMEWDYFPKYDDRGQPRVLHVFERMFAGQTRGVPWMAAALNTMKDLDDWCEAELIAKQVEACFGLIFKGGPQSRSPYEQAAANSIPNPSGGRRLEELSPGMIHYSSEDEEVLTIDPSRPGGTFAPFVENRLRTIASAINLPYEILAKNFFRTTFSSGQLAMLDGRHGFKARRQVMIEGFLVPLWDRFVDDVVFANEAEGTIDITQYVVRPHMYNNAVWVSPGWGFINPKDEVNAATTALDADITTMATLYSERGEDAEVQLAKRREEKLRVVAEDVERRKLQWDLEEAAGLPHMEEPVTPETEEEDDADNQNDEDEQESEVEAAA